MTAHKLSQKKPLFLLLGSGKSQQTPLYLKKTAILAKESANSFARIKGEAGATFHGRP